VRCSKLALFLCPYANTAQPVVRLQCHFLISFVRLQSLTFCHHRYYYHGNKVTKHNFKSSFKCAYQSNYKQFRHLLYYIIKIDLHQYKSAPFKLKFILFLSISTLSFYKT
jgi:hypothetical protein